MVGRYLGGNLKTVLAVGSLLVWLLAGPAENGQEQALAETGSLLVKNGSGRLSIDRRVLLGLVRKDLSLNTGDRISIESLPSPFLGPGGSDVSATLTKEGSEGKGEFLFLLNVMEEHVARESFFIRVRITSRKREKSYLADRSSPKKSGSGVISSGEGGESLVHAGDSVRVTARGMGFLIRFRGISQSGGFMGDRVPVVNPFSGTSMVGRITGPDRVIVDLSGSGS
jgi:hypothetical protein